MKKYISVILTFLLLFTLFACKPLHREQSETSGSEETTDTQAIETQAPETQVPETKDTEAETAEPPHSDQRDEYTPLLYRVSDEDSCIWLFGSIHLGNEKMQQLPDYITDALASSDAVAVECNIDEFEKDFTAQQQALGLLIYSDGTTISDHIDQSLYKDAKAILEENDYYISALDYYIPAMWSICIDQFSVMNSGYKLEYAIDTLVVDLAKKNGIEVREIESVMLQYDMLSGFSSALQELMLSESVREYNTGESKKQLDAMVDAWCRGDAEALFGNSDEGEEPTAEEQKLLDEYNYAMGEKRNLAMTGYAGQALHKNEEIFICVGSAHVMPEEAMADLLEQKGYTVEIVK